MTMAILGRATDSTRHTDFATGVLAEYSWVCGKSRRERATRTYCLDQTKALAAHNGQWLDLVGNV